MRIIYAADIHQAFSALGELFEHTEADLYFIAGDLVYRSFHRYQTAWRFIELEQILGGHRLKEGSADALLEVAERICREKRSDARLLSQAGEYAALCKKAERYLKQSYEALETVFSRYPERSIYVLPGNYDMDLARTALKDRNFHLKSMEMGGIRFAGYGGARAKTPGLPDHLQIPFIEEGAGDGAGSEPLEFFRKVKPDVMVLHTPPYGYLDRLQGYGNAGSQGIRTYLDEDDVTLVLSGHFHEDWGAVQDGGTLFFNPSNFGRTVEVSGIRAGGYFLTLDLEGRSLRSADLSRIEKKETYDIVEYRVSDGDMETLVLDEDRYRAMGGELPAVRHIEPVEQLKRIKSFFLGYETHETQELIGELRAICREIRAKGMEVGFDLLGSLNFGMAKKGSDMDVVVYLRGKDCVLDDEDVCGIPRPLGMVFDALKERNLNVEVCDSLDLDRVKNAIMGEDADDGQLQRFIFYRVVCRPVNRRFIKGVENLLLQKRDFRNKVENGLKDYLEILVSSVRHVKSFEKYQARLKERGIGLPPEVEEAIRNYLMVRQKPEPPKAK